MVRHAQAHRAVPGTRSRVHVAPCAISHARRALLLLVLSTRGTVVQAQGPCVAITQAYSHIIPTCHYTGAPIPGSPSPYGRRCVANADDYTANPCNVNLCCNGPNQCRPLVTPNVAADCTTYTEPPTIVLVQWIGEGSANDYLSGVTTEASKIDLMIANALSLPDSSSISHQITDTSSVTIRISITVADSATATTTKNTLLATGTGIMRSQTALQTAMTGAGVAPALTVSTAPTVVVASDSIGSCSPGATYPSATPGSSEACASQSICDGTTNVGNCFDDCNLNGVQDVYEPCHVGGVCSGVCFTQATTSGSTTTSTASTGTATTGTASTSTGTGTGTGTSTGSASARKDPHIRFADGGRADFRGEHNRIFNFLSARNVALNIKTVTADFKWTRGTIEDLAPPRLIHGTKMESAYWHVRTSTNRRILVTYSASEPTVAKLETSNFDASQKSDCQLQFLSALRACRETKTTWTTVNLQPGDQASLDNVDVHFKESERELTVTVAERWQISARVSPFPFPKLNPGQTLLDIEAKALYDADHDVVAPHGLFGQSFDGDDLMVSGKLDSRAGDESTTEAQAEGAIEGHWRDYMIKCDTDTAKAGAHCEHSIQFKYTRFDKTEAKPRNVERLSGAKRKRTPTEAYTKSSANAFADVVEKAP